MTSCDQVRSRIYAYVDGEAEAREQLAIEAHCSNANACRAEHDAIRQVVDTIRGAKPLYQPSAALTASVQKIIEEHCAVRRRRRWLIAATAGAGVGVILAGLPTIHTHRSVPSPPRPTSLLQAAQRFSTWIGRK